MSILGRQLLISSPVPIIPTLYPLKGLCKSDQSVRGF